VIRDWGEPDAANLVMEDGLGSTIFTLVQSEAFEPRKFPKNDYEVEHYFNFLTPDPDALHRKLVNSGVNVTEMREIGYHRFFAFFDPDGNRFGAVGRVSAGRPAAEGR
jgi:hypothetical protein